MKRITILILVILFSLSGLAESTTWFCPPGFLSGNRV